jgi:GR25 family glycosyltransferase involved in LPS biosynthesis
MPALACDIAGATIFSTIFMAQLFLIQLYANLEPPTRRSIAGADNTTLSPLSTDTRETPTPPRIHSLYLNMDGRGDRKRDIEESFAATKWVGLERFPAVNGSSDPRVALLCPAHESPRGMVKYGSCRGRTGCKLSHLGALRLARDRDYPSIAIFEDDFVFHASTSLRPGDLQQAVRLVMARIRDWDVIVLSGKYKRANMNRATWVPLGDPHGANSTQTTGHVVVRLYKSFLTTAYIVNSSYIPVLAANMEECDTARGGAIDLCWGGLQGRDRWYAVNPVLGVQTEGFSDLRGIVMKQRDY